MSIEAVWTLAVVGGMTVLLARERLGAELVVFLALCCLVVTGVVDSATALEGFGNSAVATIAVLFVVAAAVRETGALRTVLGVLLGPASTVRGAMVRVMLPTAVMSAFVNNTPIIALLIPSIRDYSRRVQTTPSKLLIPLAYAAMLG
ncbi:MAG: di/tricarboxylate transporter, partial [bacterium]